MAGRALIRAIPLLAGVLVAVIAFQLGSWQLRRAAEKEALQARIERMSQQAPLAYNGESPLQEWQRLAVEGRWLADRPAYIDNRVHDGQAGYYLVMPLLLAGSGAVLLVNRGWVPVGADRRSVPAVKVPDGVVEVAGVVRLPEEKPFALSERQVDGVVWQNLDLNGIAAQLGRTVLPFVLQQSSAADDGLVRDWPRPDAGIERHKGYALQWYGLCALAVVLMGIHVFRRWRRNDDAQG